MTCFLPDELYVTNIPGEASQAEVVSLLEQFGKVKEYVVVSKRREHNLTQAALVRMEDNPGALAVKKALNRIDFKSKQLNIRWSHTQRVIWASNLHESVTNEMLRAAFSQFGSIQRALVVADAQTLATKCFGFVVFENKKDAGRAMAKCVEQPFMIGQSNKPVKVDWARLEDTDQGYSEEVRSGKGATANKDLNPRTISRFAAQGSREYLLAVRLAEVDVEYQQMKQAMHSKMVQLQEQLMATGHAPSLATSLASDPQFAAIRAAGAPPPMFAPQAVQPPQNVAPQPLQQAPPTQYGPPPVQYAPPPAQYGPPPGQYAPPPGQYGQGPQGPLPMKRENDEFHHVPPPKRSAMRPKDPDFERFNPEASARAHNPVPPPAKPPAAPAPAPSPLPTLYKLPPVAPATAFVKGGQLNNAAAVSVEAPRSDPNGAHQQQQQQQQGQQVEGEAPAAAAPPGAKPPGQPDFRGIGFTGSVPPPQPPPSAPYAPTQQQQFAQYQAPPPQQQQQQQQYGQSYAAPAPGPAPAAYNPYAQPPPQQQQHAPPVQQYSYPPPQQQQQQAPAPQQQYAQQQYAPPQQQQAPAQYGTPQPAPQYAPAGQYGTPAQYAAPQPSSYQTPAAQTSPPAMSGYNVVGGQQQQQPYAGQYAQPTYY